MDEPIETLNMAERLEERILRLATVAMRDADADFQKCGGSTRHYIRDCFMPRLKQQGLKIVLTENADTAVES